MSPATAQNIQAANRTFEQHVVAQRNIDALDNVYTKDARILPPGGEMVSGRENIKAFWKGAIEGLNVSAVTLSTVDFEAAGDTGYEIGRAVLSFAGGGEMVAKYVVIWKQEDGMWKWHVDIWNPNA
ncbi:MAG TPA: nuclear transport factor 2 family protein [Candidatus Sulfopaludibacter sp.]|jgi:ketosteroid isomerase-like protein|nr:nuclear transport factor 2 family protein [Candidatus Sulfopaludibacter sp.]